MMFGYIPIPTEIAPVIYAIAVIVPVILVSWMAIGRFNAKKKAELRELVKTEKVVEMKTEKWKHEYTVAYIGAIVLTALTTVAALTVILPSRGMDTAGEYIYAAALLSSLGSLIYFIGARLTADSFLDAKLIKPLEEKAKVIIEKAAPSVIGTIESQLDDMTDEKLFALSELAMTTLKKRK